MPGHEYNPDPRTGRCLDCSHWKPARGRCLWCGHSFSEHDGNVSAEVRAHYELTPATATAPATSRVKWTPTACSRPHCACRTYERN